jgi:hypothetical protein
VTVHCHVHIARRIQKNASSKLRTCTDPCKPMTLGCQPFSGHHDLPFYPDELVSLYKKSIIPQRRFRTLIVRSLFSWPHPCVKPLCLPVAKKGDLVVLLVFVVIVHAVLEGRV